MDFAYKTYFKTAPNTGYETLIYDCMIGDATLFQRADNIEAGWQAVQPILDVWANNPPEGLPQLRRGRERSRRRGRIVGARRTRVAAARLRGVILYEIVRLGQHFGVSVGYREIAQTRASLIQPFQ